MRTNQKEDGRETPNKLRLDRRKELVKDYHKKHVKDSSNGTLK